MASDNSTTREDLVEYAREVSHNAVAHHSHFHVGAALETESGKIYTGCNVESDSYGLTICAERVALTKALSEGERNFTRIAIIGIQHDSEGNPLFGKSAMEEAQKRGNSSSKTVNDLNPWLSQNGEVSASEAGQPLGPCGACRQLLWDHCRDIEVIGATPMAEIGKVWRLADLLPYAFNFEGAGSAKLG